MNANESATPAGIATPTPFKTPLNRLRIAARVYGKGAGAEEAPAPRLEHYNAFR